MPVLREVVVGVVLHDPACAIQIARVKRVLVCLDDIPRQARDDDHERNAEPEVGGAEEVMVVAVDGGGEPSRGDEGVDSLSKMSASTKHATRERSYRVCPDEHDTKGNSEEDPASPHVSVETVEKISCHHSPYGHDLSDSCQQTLKTCSRSTVTYSRELILVHIVPIGTRTSGHVGVVDEEVHDGRLAIVVSILAKHHERIDGVPA